MYPSWDFFRISYSLLMLFHHITEGNFKVSFRTKDYFAPCLGRCIELGLSICILGSGDGGMKTDI